MTWRETVQEALLKLGGSAKLDQIYISVRELRQVQGLSLPKSFKAVIRKELEYNSSDSSNWKGSEDLFFSVHGIGQGVWGLRSFIPPIALAVDLGDFGGKEVVERRETVISRVVRDTVMTRKIKALHGNACQICGLRIETPKGDFYAEAHHIVPLGKPHHGEDRPENIIVVCPNHHAMLDLGCTQLDPEEIFTVEGHEISGKNLEYHNTEIFASR